VNFEEELRYALQRKEPATGFRERVLRQVEPPIRTRPLWAKWAPPVAVAASLFAGVLGVVRYEEYRKAERAKEQLMTAFRIYTKTLGTVERKLRKE